jgi:hypothetical protein
VDLGEALRVVGEGSDRSAGQAVDRELCALSDPMSLSDQVVHPRGELGVEQLARIDLCGGGVRLTFRQQCLEAREAAHEHGDGRIVCVQRHRCGSLRFEIMTRSYALPAPAY